jgi:hypothetical protein
VPVVPTKSKSRFVFDLWSTFVVLAVGLAFWLPGFRRTGGKFPIPLDDVYIHFAFARSAALGHPFEWSIGNGYSSGGTSLTYPFVLAPGWLLGFRAEKLAWFAAFITCLCLIDVCRSLRNLVSSSSRLVAFVVPLVLLAVPLADWSFYSGMETALFAAVLGRFVVAAQKASSVESVHRASAQWTAGLWGALVVATRPEAAAIVLPLGVSIVYAARSLGTWSSLLRSFGPVFMFLGLQAAANFHFTSEVAQAGAVRKLVGTNPYITPPEIAVEVLKNLIVLQTQAFDAALGGRPWSLVLLLFVIIAIARQRTRLLALPLTFGAVGMLLLVSLNTTARYQNLRYAVPSLLALLFVALLGLGALFRQNRGSKIFAALGAGVLILAPFRHFSRQIDHFARSSANIEGQQATVGRRLAEQTPLPRRVFVGDAGAIPYLSGIPGLDGLGLGGYHDLPFARASLHGVPAVIELIERLPIAERPDVLAIYPTWWSDIAASFAKERFTVHIDDNVICASPDKVVYSADWSSLAAENEVRPGTIDEIDIGDLVSERAHHYSFSPPRSGWIIGTTLKDAQRRTNYDAGRIIPEGRSASFILSLSMPRGPANLVLRTDADAVFRISVEVVRLGQTVWRIEQNFEGRVGDGWNEPMVTLPEVVGGDTIKIGAVMNAFRHHHVWITR